VPDGKSFSTTYFLRKLIDIGWPPKSGRQIEFLFPIEAYLVYPFFTTFHPSIGFTFAIVAMNRAYALRKPKTGLSVHSDQGSKFASKAYREQLAKFEIEKNCHFNPLPLLESPE